MAASTLEHPQAPHYESALRPARQPRPLAKTGASSWTKVAAESERYQEALAKVEVEIARAERYHHPLALLWLGGAGDESFRSQAPSLAGLLRRCDLLCPWSATSDILLLPETGLAGALRVRRRLLEAARPRLSRASDEDSPPAIGMAIYPVEGVDASSLCRLARMRSERWHRKRGGLAQLASKSFRGICEALLDDPAQRTLPQRASTPEPSRGSAASFSHEGLAHLASYLLAEAFRQPSKGMLALGGIDSVALTLGARLADLAGVEATLRLHRLGLAADPQARDSERAGGFWASDRVDFFLFWMTEYGAYVLLGRRESAQKYRVFHSSDALVVSLLCQRFEEGLVQDGHA